MSSKAEGRLAQVGWRLAGGTFVVALALILLSVYDEPTSRTLIIGQVSPQTFVAPVELQVIDRLATEQRRQLAVAQVPELTSPNPSLTQVVLDAPALATLPSEVLALVHQRYRDSRGVPLAEVTELINNATLLAPPLQRFDVALVLRATLVATAIPDGQLTDAARAATAASVPAVMRSLAAGEVIVRQGDLLSPEVLATLEAVGLYAPRSEDFVRALLIGVGVLLLALLLSLPLPFASDRLAHDYRKGQMVALFALTIVALVAQRLALEISPNFIVVLLVPLLVAVLVSQEAAVLWAVWMAVITALLVPSTPMVTLLATLIGGIVAVHSVRNVQTRPAVVMAGALAGLVGGLALVGWVLAGGGLSPVATAVAFATFAAGGVLAGILALGLLPLFEVGAGFLTSFRLLELSSPSHPLLQRMMLEAPGSYQHSLIISNLVEPAVAAIGGNALLARVGSLYHDVGKMRRPHFFVENQFGRDNPHDRISPHLSYLIITSHARDGVEMLRQARMPRELESFALEHHGTTVLAYFYKRALEDSASVAELNFRYPGPRPRSKETAVLMLADAVESAARTLEDPTQGSIRALIERLFEQRVQDDQLSQSPLNLHDFEIIAATFERMLTAIMHRRIQYPTAEEMRGTRGADRDSGRDRSLPSA